MNEKKRREKDDDDELHRAEASVERVEKRLMS